MVAVEKTAASKVLLRSSVPLRAKTWARVTRGALDEWMRWVLQKKNPEWLYSGEWSHAMVHY